MRLLCEEMRRRGGVGVWGFFVFFLMVQNIKSGKKRKNKSAKANQSERERHRITSERRDKSRLQTEFRILLHISGWLWIIEEQPSQAQLYSLHYNIWKHNSNVASCTGGWGESDAVYPISMCIDCSALTILPVQVWRLRFFDHVCDRKRIATSHATLFPKTSRLQRCIFFPYLSLK